MLIYFQNDTRLCSILYRSPTCVIIELDLNIFSAESDLPHVKAQSNGVRSGYYSAAFLLQRILADKLDVDPTEIEIADIFVLLRAPHVLTLDLYLNRGVPVKVLVAL